MLLPFCIGSVTMLLLSIGSIVSTLKSKLTGNQTGEALAGVLVGIALTGTVGVVFLQGIGTTTECTSMTDDLNIRANLATNQMEYIKNQDISNDVWNYTLTTSQRSSSQLPSWADDSTPSPLANKYRGYSVVCFSERIDFNDDGASDDGAFKITVQAFNTSDPESVTRLISYKDDQENL